jgi:hypothetical protein
MPYLLILSATVGLAPGGVTPYMCADKYKQKRSIFQDILGRLLQKKF